MKTKSQKPKICFVALSAYPMLSQASIKIVGGAEVQQILLAKELKKNGFDVSFVVFDHGQKVLETINGINVFKACRADDLIKRRYVGAYLILRAINRTNADLYYVRGGKLLAGLVAFYCIFKKKKLVYSVASDMDVSLKGKRFFKAFFYKFGIKSASLVIALNAHQQQLLKKNFNKESAVIKSACVLPDRKPKKRDPPVVLWVGTMKKEWKQPELFLKLAKSIPNAKFQMIGGPSQEDPQYFEEIKRLASEIPNLEFVGFVPYHLINQYFDKASIFVNTSSIEGFPNTFLQAWAGYTPVVSLNVDPDEIICRYKLGFHSKTFRQMIEDVKFLLGNKKLREELGMNGRRYVEGRHDMKNIARRYIELFHELL